MMTQTHPTGKPPWQEYQISYGLKILVYFVVGVLLIAAVLSGLALLTGILSIVINGPGPNATLESVLKGIATLIVTLLGSIGGTVALWPYYTAPADFKPGYGGVPAITPGHPFDVRYICTGWRQMPSGKGSIRFDADALKVTAMLMPGMTFQLVMLLLLIALLLFLLPIGLAFLMILLIGFFMGRKRIELTLPYTSIRNVSVKGCQLRMHTAGTPQRIALSVASADGERLYRELHIRYPLATDRWQ